MIPPRWQGAFWAVALFLFLAAGFASIFLPESFRKGGAPVIVTLEPGLSTRDIAQRLAQRGIVRSSPAFRLVALLRGQSQALQAGTYEMYPWESLPRLVDRMAKGDVVRVEVTIPEGLSAREIASRVAPVLGCSEGDFMAAVDDSTLAASLGLPGPTLEGYLFPDTYRVIPGTSPLDLVRRLVGRMTEVYSARYAHRADSLGLTRHQAITLASLVEAEAKVDEERPRIAAVFLNRLHTGMKLQSDPTVAYALGGHPERLYEKDLEIVSPYNTYLVTGLPPGPICSPGESSLRAAVNPLPGCEDFYFVATGDGRHLFSRTNADHNTARREVARGQAVPTAGGRETRGKSEERGKEAGRRTSGAAGAPPG